MSSKKNVGRKRLGRIQISGPGHFGSDSGHNQDRPFQLQSKGAKRKELEVSRSQQIKDDLSFSTSFACDLDADLDIMSALDKMEKDHGRRDQHTHGNSDNSGAYNHANSGNAALNKVDKNGRAASKNNTESPKTRTGQSKNIQEKQCISVDVKGHHEEANVIISTPTMPVSGHNRKTYRKSSKNTPVYVSDNMTWESPVDVSTPLDVRHTRALRSSSKKDVSHPEEGAKREKTVTAKSKKSLTPKTTSGSKRSTSKLTYGHQSKNQSKKITPVSVSRAKNERSNSEFFNSLLLDNDSMEMSLNQKSEKVATEKEHSSSAKFTVGHTLQSDQNADYNSITNTGTILTSPSDKNSGARVQKSAAIRSSVANDWSGKENKGIPSNEKSSVERNDQKNDSLEVTNKTLETGTVIQSDDLSLSSWGLPEPVLKQYTQRGITHMFKWQAECLLTGNVLEGGNLVYSAPTSAGKTMVAELLVLKKVVETRKKAIIILPFVSVTREKMFYLQELFQDAGIRVSGFMGHYSPAGGFSSVDVAVCTIEKGNGLINRMLEEKKLDKLGIIVVDELHLIGDPHRGYLLELLLTKISYMAKKRISKPGEDGVSNPVQIVGMSATLPNLDLLASWLNADLYRTDYRPVPLLETMKIGTAIYNSNMEIIRDVDITYKVKGDTEHVVPLCIETIRDGHSILIFCPTKNWCEKLSETIARELYNLLKNPTVATASTEESKKMEGLLVLPLNPQSLRDTVEQLKRTPVGVDQVLGRTVPFGVAYHHAGLTFDERDIVEGAFRQGVLKVLVATSTLSSGVNLPARRVLIRTPVFHGGKVIDFLTYKQMIGRAGRKGVDTAGESILLCKPSEKSKAVELVTGQLPAVKSTLIRNESEELSSSMKRAILEVVVSGVAMETKDVGCYASCTMLAASLPADSGQTQKLIDQCIHFLQENEFVCKQSITNDEGVVTERFIPTQLGAAVLASSLSPDEGLKVFSELQRARQCFVLESELHVIYQVTPIYSGVGDYIDWYQFFCIWETLTPSMRNVAEIIGVQESYLARSVRGKPPCKTAAQQVAFAIHKRFYASLVLHDLVQEVPLSDVAKKYNCNKGQLQSLQQSAATFAGMVTVFCARLGWSNLELILSQFQNRLTFGVQRELCDLVRISTLNGQRARVLYNGGYQTVAALASAHPADIEALLKNSAPFQSTKRQGTESEWEAEERRKSRCIFLTGRKGVTEYEAAVIITDEAKAIVQDELGGLGIQWSGGTRDRKPELTSPVLTSPLISQCRKRVSLLKRKSPSSLSGDSDKKKLDKQSHKESPASSERKIPSPNKRMSTQHTVLQPNSLEIRSKIPNDACKLQTQAEIPDEGTVKKTSECGVTVSRKVDVEEDEEGETTVVPLKKQKLIDSQPQFGKQNDPSKHREVTTSNIIDVNFKRTFELENAAQSIQSKSSSGVSPGQMMTRQDPIKETHCSNKTNSLTCTPPGKSNNSSKDSDLRKESTKHLNLESKLVEMDTESVEKISDKSKQSEDTPKTTVTAPCAVGDDVIDDEFLETFVLDTQTSKEIISGISNLSSTKRDIQKVEFVSEKDAVLACVNSEALFSDIDNSPTNDNDIIMSNSGQNGHKLDEKVHQVLDYVNSEALFSEVDDNSPSDDNGIIISNSRHKLNENVHQVLDYVNSEGLFSEVDDNSPSNDNDIIVSNSGQKLNENVHPSLDDALQLQLSESLEGDKTCNDLDMNVFHNSNEDMFNMSEDIIAASNYERVGLSGDNNNDRLNNSYEDLHIPYQSGQEACFEKGDKNKGVDDDINGDAKVCENNRGQIVVDRIGLFSSPEPEENRDGQTECDNSFSSTFNISEVNLDVLNVHGAANTHKMVVCPPSSDMVIVSNVAGKGKVSPNERSIFGDSLTDSMIDKALLENCDNYEQCDKATKSQGSSSKQSCDNSVSKMPGKVKTDKNETVNGKKSPNLCMSTECFVTPKVRAVKRARHTPVDRNAKMAKKVDVNHSTPDAKRKDSLRKTTITTSENTVTPVKNKTGSNSEAATGLSGQVVSPSVHNVSSGSDCVPPTPPDEDQLQNTTTPKRTPLRSFNSLGYSSSLKLSKKKAEESKQQNFQLKTKSSKSNPAQQDLSKSKQFTKQIKHTNNGDVTMGENDGETRKCNPVKQDITNDQQFTRQATNIETNDNDIEEDGEIASDTEGGREEDEIAIDAEGDREDGETAKGNREDKLSPSFIDPEGNREDKLSPSFIDPEESGLPLTQASFTIIDVCGDKQLFKHFIMEWRTKPRYTVSLACERRPMMAKNMGIGLKYRKDSSPVRQSAGQTEDGIVLEGDLVIVGVAVSWDNRDAYYVSFTHTHPTGSLDDSLAPPPSDKDISIGIRIKAVKSVLQQTMCKDSPVTRVMFDVKSQYRVLAEGCGFVPKGNFEDPRVACWMLDPGARERTLHGMVTNLLPSEVHLLQGLCGGIGLGSVGLNPENPGSGRYRATTECVLVRHLGEYLRACLEKEALYNVYSEMEMPAAISLCRMELNGFGFSQEESESQKSVMIAKLSALEEQAYMLAGHPFSLSSTEDISQILYVELQLPPSGDPSSVPVRSLAPKGVGTRRAKGKSQYSTSKDVLEKLSKLHSLPGVILEWRRITNALTKVVFPLQKEKIRCENLSMYRIYSECQLHTATGRVSLSEPNLQNVPKDFKIVMPDMIGESPSEDSRRRTRGGSRLQQMIGAKQVAKVTDENKGIEFSVSMRHAFVPFEGGVLLAADYSQLELRMIAYLSKDAKLISVLNEDGDVFKLITAQWKNISPNDVTLDQRAQAKQVCYGMIYGIGPRALGEQLEVDENDAAAFIETFKAKYPGMRKYLRTTVELCREKGYVQTMVGRKRYLQAITNGNPHARAQAERQAVNTTVQGSAADLVKQAMIKIDESLGQKYPLSQYCHKLNLPDKHPARQTCPPEGAYMVLQLHDELIYEVNKSHVKDVANIVKTCMENAMELPVKMPVKVKIGQSWGTLEEVDL